MTFCVSVVMKQLPLSATEKSSKNVRFELWRFGLDFLLATLEQNQKFLCDNRSMLSVSVTTVVLDNAVVDFYS